MCSRNAARARTLIQRGCLKRIKQDKIVCSIQNTVSIITRLVERAYGYYQRISAKRHWSAQQSVGVHSTTMDHPDHDAALLSWSWVTRSVGFVRTLAHEQVDVSPML